MKPGSGTRIALGEDCVRTVRSETVVELLPSSPLLRGRSRRELELRHCRTEIQTSAADNDWRASRREQLVHGRVGKSCVLGDRSFMTQRPDADEPRRPVGLSREDRQAAVRLHRIGGDHLATEQIRHRFADSGLARPGRTEDRDDARRS
jgi:hypothetical protein